MIFFTWSSGKNFLAVGKRRDGPLLEGTLEERPTFWVSKLTAREIPEADPEWLTPTVRTKPWFSSQSLGPATEALGAGQPWQQACPCTLEVFLVVETPQDLAFHSSRPFEHWKKSRRMGCDVVGSFFFNIIYILNREQRVVLPDPQNIPCLAYVRRTKGGFPQTLEDKYIHIEYKWPSIYPYITYMHDYIYII
jgi:hypothetical protein